VKADKIESCNKIKPFAECAGQRLKQSGGELEANLIQFPSNRSLAEIAAA